MNATDRAVFGLDTDKVPYSKYSQYSSYGAGITGKKPAGGTTPKGQRVLTASECEAGGFLWTGSACGFDRSSGAIYHQKALVLSVQRTLTMNLQII